MRLGVVAFAVLVAGAGCDRVFDLTRPPDAPIEPDAPQACDEITANDEDGDGIRDGCDNCPTIDNGDQANTTETTNDQPIDALGDACDPNPTTSGDVVFRFYTFDSADATAFMATAGAWAITDGAYHVDGDDAHNGKTWLVNLAGQPDRPFTVETRVHLTSVPQTMFTARGAGIELEPDANDLATQCILERPYEWPAQADRFVSFTYNDNKKADLDTFTPGVTFRITATYNATHLRCTLGGDAAASANGLLNSRARMIRTSLYAREVDAVFDYLIIYGIAL